MANVEFPTVKDQVNLELGEREEGRSNSGMLGVRKLALALSRITDGGGGWSSLRPLSMQSLLFVDLGSL